MTLVPSDYDRQRFPAGQRVKTTPHSGSWQYGIRQGVVVGWMRFGELLRSEAARLAELVGERPGSLDAFIPPGLAEAGVTLGTEVLAIEFSADEPLNDLQVTMRFGFPAHMLGTLEIVGGPH